MVDSPFKSSVSVTYIGTATAILDIEGVTFLTDPYFSPAGTEWDVGIATLTSHYEPALSLDQLPPVDVVLLSHEDHPDNLDELSRDRLLSGRRVLTTVDGASKLNPRPGVQGLRPWEKTTLNVGGKVFQVIATPCQHLPGGECTGFLLTTVEFGTTNGLPNAIYFSGDTVYLEELANIRDRFHISLAIFNLGAASVMLPGSAEPLLITMDGTTGAKLFREIGADILVPLHFESWDHFSQSKEALATAFESAGISDKVHWLEPGKSKRIL
ncbi:Metallo-hydrolase/oxidoreductase [Annulohypoxylon maeteangense]|uniref:Metallo-hydrolase/oxidoreductase n=1 Tax=Annulohypoxylon maeteangense TaxID=1927788 RepID=UPI002008D400|nr:Metallo-hydrolase/oxidoreductase [Annulohypoxylon maeteangense]KAI0879987.1 Metallo-hydrolase/oxidoreductase [Annulohypoxylon maeteangense]